MTAARTPRKPKTDTRVQVAVDLNDWTFAELVTLEELTGVDLETLFRPQLVTDRQGRPVDEDGVPTEDPKRYRWSTRLSARETQCLIWIVLRRDRPGMTLEEAGDLPVAQVTIRARRAAGPSISAA